MGRRKYKVWFDQRAGAPNGPSVASNIDLADGVPRHPLIVDARPIVCADYAWVQLLA